MSWNYPKGVLLCLLWGAGAGAGAGPVTAQSSDVVIEESVFAVVTHKAGIAAGLAHDHLVTAGVPVVELQFDGGSPTQTGMRFEIAAEKLIVDDPDLRRRWYPRLKELGILHHPLGELSEKNRRKIRRTMLGQKQLAAEEFPMILASVVEVRALDPSNRFEVDLALTVRERAVTRSLTATYSVTGDRVTIEAHGTFRFTDFGIKPYSAMLSAVRNTDEFHVYTYLVVTVGEKP